MGRLLVWPGQLLRPTQPLIWLVCILQPGQLHPVYLLPAQGQLALTLCGQIWLVVLHPSLRVIEIKIMVVLGSQPPGHQQVIKVGDLLELPLDLSNLHILPIGFPVLQ